jgi:osmotically-inducible protein OsmY
MPVSRRSGDLSFGQKVDDATTTAAIHSKLLWGATTSGLAIKVVTVRGKVRLDGTVYDSAERDLIGQVAADTAGALSVTNEIVVFSVPPVTSGAQTDAQKLVDDRRRPVSDVWITARIQSTFLLSPSINRSAISIATSEGSVSLSGIAGSPSARMSAIALAKNTRGVQSVDGTRLVAN